MQLLSSSALLSETGSAGVSVCFALFKCSLDTEILSYSEFCAEVAGQASEDNTASAERPGGSAEKTPYA